MAFTEYLISMAFAVFTAAAFILAGIALVRNADMEINDTFGYRTQRSTQNKETWHFANVHSGKILIIGGVIGLALIILTALIMEMIGVNKMAWLVGVILELVIVFTVIPINMASTENQLKKRFGDKEESNDKG
ncbi:MAG: SdpI family protein [Ruminococcus sp.]|nr:SdpI family protein [Ruminococcus sp.]